MQGRNRATEDSAGTVNGVNAPRIARRVLIAILGGYGIFTVVDLVNRGVGPLAAAAGAVALIPIVLLQVRHSTICTRSPTRWITLAGQAVPTFVPLIWFGTAWSSLTGFLAGSLLILVPDPWKWASYGAACLIPLGVALGHYSTLAHSAINAICAVRLNAVIMALAAPSFFRAPVARTAPVQWR